MSSAEMHTQEAVEEDFDDAEEQVIVWGRLYPLGNCFTSVGKTKNSNYRICTV